MRALLTSRLSCALVPITARNQSLSGNVQRSKSWWQTTSRLLFLSKVATIDIGHEALPPAHNHLHE